MSLEEVQMQSLRYSEAVDAAVELSPEGHRSVQSPVRGRAHRPAQGGPDVGDRVERGDTIARVVPMGASEEIASLQSDYDAARAERRFAHRELERIDGLVEDGAIAERRRNEAKRNVDIADAALERARKRLDQTSDRALRDEGVALASPISGVMTERDFTSGEVVSTDRSIAQIVHTDQRRLSLRIPYSTMRRIDEPAGGWIAEPGGDITEFTFGGDSELLTKERFLESPGQQARWIVSFDDPTRLPAAGAVVEAHLHDQEGDEVLSVPRRAVVYDGGMESVYLQVDDESFERRVIQTGRRDRELVEIKGGLHQGDHVVTHGAYYLRLAGAASDDIGHGHAH